MPTKKEERERKQRLENLRQRCLRHLKLKTEIKKDTVDYLEKKLKRKKEKLKFLEDKFIFLKFKA